MNLKIGQRVKTADSPPGYKTRSGEIIEIKSGLHKVRWSDGFTSGWLRRNWLKRA